MLHLPQERQFFLLLVVLLPSKGYPPVNVRSRCFPTTVREHTAPEADNHG